MAYSRWGESYWYTYWASPGQGVEESRDTEVFEICPVAFFTAKQLREDLDGCMKQVAETMTFDRKPTPQELEDKFLEVMQNNVPARRGYDAAKALGMDEESRLKAAIIQLTEMNRRAMAIITDAIMHGMPISKEVADVRNQIVGASRDVLREV